MAGEGTGARMLRAALRDLQWRRKRFVITIVGTALVFAMSLLMSGLSNSFTVEIDRTLTDQRGEWWVTRSDAAGAFSPGSFLTNLDVAAITAPTSGFSEAEPLMFGSTTVETHPGAKNNTVMNVTLFGVVPGKIGAPMEVTSGSTDLTDSQVIVPEKLGVHVDDTVRVAGIDLKVVGVVSKASLVAGAPTLTVTLPQSQQLLVGGQPLSSMVVARGTPTLPTGYRAYTRDEAHADLIRPLKNAVQSIDFVKILLWLVAGLIIASVVYLTVLERTRDIAVFKATGVSNAAIGAGICLQAVILAVTASLVGIVLAIILAPWFPMDVVISTGAMVGLPILAVVVGVLAGLFGVRRTTSVSPATAFGGP
jgi:putative ABC transport system permease protein